MADSTLDKCLPGEKQERMLALKSLPEYTAAAEAAICLLIFRCSYSLVAASFYIKGLKSVPLFLLIPWGPG